MSSRSDLRGARHPITYSLSVPDAPVRGLSFRDSYAYLGDWVLGELGIRACYQPLNDIATDQGKVAGAAQKRVVGPGGGPVPCCTT
ncbi:hypothetical protein FM21_18220 [Streptomyces mutabilis]|uniref:Uncharacterized protein n=1 Tax=Streptomyces mutabilis TaxID=67332 RepID=A0A086MV95_9ACTN|nr:hypothetical protein FM21_18220 [Streptomyces mutabilis]